MNLTRTWNEHEIDLRSSHGLRICVKWTSKWLQVDIKMGPPGPEMKFKLISDSSNRHQIDFKSLSNWLRIYFTWARNRDRINFRSSEGLQIHKMITRLTICNNSSSKSSEVLNCFLKLRFLETPPCSTLQLSSNHAGFKLAIPRNHTASDSLHLAWCHCSQALLKRSCVVHL